MRAALLVLIALVASAYAQGTTQPYRVKPDDTLDVIAAEFYGDRAQSKLIVAENKLTKRKLQPGQRLKIPVTREITTDKGDTFDSLAQTHLGDAKRAVVLADFNEREVTDIPAIGTTITIPIQIAHVAQGSESLASIATLYWGDSKQADVLRRYNFLDKQTVEKGESVIVPMIKVRVRKPSALDGDAKERRDQKRNADADAARALPVARSAWLAADFAGAKAALEPLADRVDYLDTEQAVEVGLLLGKAMIAFDDTTHAVQVFARAHSRKPSVALSPYAESPKVIEAWKKAGGQLSQ
ncbi:MAG TPA: LysM domain-containing protein [Kofleriaceae bacterium]